MKFKALTTGLITLAAVAAWGLLQAQPQPPEPGPPPDHPQHWQMSPEQKLNQLSQQLNLTPDQQSKLQAVFQEMHTNIVNAIEEARTNANTQLQQILTPQQYQQFQALWQQHERRWKGQDGNGDNEQEQNESNQPPTPPTPPQQ